MPSLSDVGDRVTVMASHGTQKGPNGLPALRRAVAILGFGPGCERPGDKNPNQNGRQTEPGHGILQMVVGQADDELARLRQAARRHRALLFDIEGSDLTWPLAETFGQGDRHWVARKPEIMSRIVIGREPMPGVR